MFVVILSERFPNEQDLHFTVTEDAQSSASIPEHGKVNFYGPMCLQRYPPVEKHRSLQVASVCYGGAQQAVFQNGFPVLA